MKIALYSDLHLEHTSWLPPPRLKADLVILAGDIDVHTRGLAWASKAFGGRLPVVYVAGNHEYYDAQLGMIEEFRKPEWREQNVHFLDREVFTIGDLRVLGATLWSDFALFGQECREGFMDCAKRGVLDFEVIFGAKGRRITPLDMWHLHKTAVRWLEIELAKPWHGKTMVVTHFAPHWQCVAEEFRESDLSPYFVTDLSRLMARYPIDFWCYGHTHTNVNFVAENGCQVISNARGYGREHRFNGFNERAVIEIGADRQEISR